MVKYSTVGHHSAVKKDQTADTQQRGWMSKVFWDMKEAGLNSPYTALGKQELPTSSLGWRSARDDRSEVVVTGDSPASWLPCCLHTSAHRVHTDALTLLLCPSRVTWDTDGNRARLPSEPSLQLPVSLKVKLKSDLPRTLENREMINSETKIMLNSE